MMRGSDLGKQQKEDLTDLFVERNLNLPKTLAQQSAYSSGKQEAVSSQSMSKALDTALKTEMARDIYPSMNFFRTEEKQGKSSFKDFQLTHVASKATTTSARKMRSWFSRMLCARLE